MKCPLCGQEIPDKSKFCPLCGRNVNEKTEEAAGDKETSNKGIYLLISAVGVVVAAIVVLFVLIIIHRPNESLQEALSENVQGEVNESEEDSAESTADVEAAEEDTEQQTEEANLSDILVTAPADYLSLRISPGLGDDVIAQLPAGCYLRWDGETVTENEHEFYKVTVEESGEVG